MKRFILLTLVFQLVLALSASGFDGKRKGFVLGGGLGFGPVAMVSVDAIDGDLTKSGFGTNFLIGFAFDEKNMIVYLRDAVFYSDEVIEGYYRDRIWMAQGFSGAAYFHYFSKVGNSAYMCLGLGFQNWMFLDSDLDNPEQKTGMLLGGGYEFARHLQIHGSVSFGKTHFPTADVDHLQYLITFSAVAF